ncbi:response regulator [Cytophagaceae bacterium ABcell3]|nr:response regulator [Cytophagaceae bacterium ABcell3]
MSQFKTVLLIDDDNINNFINQRLIKKAGLAQKVEVSTNGEEGLKFIRETYKSGKNCPDLILLDINMPVMDGFDFIRVFENMDYINKDKTKIIVLTTSSNKKDIQTLKKLGCINYINKPLTAEKLSSCLEGSISLI